MSLLHFILFLFVSLYGPVSLAEKDCEAEEHLVIQNISTGMFGQLLNHKLESAHQLNPLLRERVSALWKHNCIIQCSSYSVFLQ